MKTSGQEYFEFWGPNNGQVISEEARDKTDIPTCVIVNLCAHLFGSRRNQESLRKIINDGFPLAVLRQRECHLNDYLLLGAIIITEEEFDGTTYSESYREAYSRLLQKLRERKCDA